MALQPNPHASAPYTQSSIYWAHAIAAGHLHDAAAGAAALKSFDELLEATSKSPRTYLIEGMKNEHKVIEAWSLYASGRTDEATRMLAERADKQDKLGKGETAIPARELLADMLLEAGKPQEALAQYEIALKTDPNRFNGLYGAAQAANELQQKDKAAAYVAQLLKNCDGIHSDRPELAQAKTLLASN
jgi:tetratricopeptide (TPR) repeat protein